MEDTLQNKILYLGSHMFQTILFDGKIRGQLHGINNKVLLDLIVLEDWDNGTPIYKEWCSADTAVELTSLENITDEDALAIAKIGLPDRLYDYLWSKETGHAMAKVIFRGRQNNTFYKEFRMADVFDYLRAKGYALSFMGRDVEWLIKEGYLVLKKEL